MNGRVLSEEQIQAVSEHYEWDNFDDDAQKTIHDLIATIRDRNKLLCIEKQSNRTLALMVDRAKEALEERDKTIAELQWVQAKFEQYYQIASEQSGRASKAEQQNTILREALEAITDSSGSTLEWSYVWEIAFDALAKVNNV